MWIRLGDVIEAFAVFHSNILTVKFNHFASVCFIYKNNFNIKMWQSAERDWSAVGNICMSIFTYELVLR